MKRVTISILGIFCLVFFAGCAAQKDTAEIEQKSQNIPDSSPFSKIETEMSMQQVVDLIGEPNERNTTQSGKQWIPFYFGGDYMHTVFYYKNLGRVIFNNSKQVIQIEYDQSEDGYIGDN